MQPTQNSDENQIGEEDPKLQKITYDNSLGTETEFAKMGRILVAEDQLINIQVIKSQLAELGLINRTTFCTNGQEAVDEVARTLVAPENERPISLVLTDFQMPKKNGIQLMKEVELLYERHQNLHCPKFVFVTAFISSQFSSYLKEQGINHLDEKPLQDS